MAHVVTYATHAQGMFDDLVNNKQGIPVTVLGWGDKWISFTENKIKGVYEYLVTLPTDTIVIFVDGFDTKINGTVDAAVREFMTFNKDIVVSMGNAGLGAYLTKRVFGTCDDTFLNTGLLMGYAGPLSTIYKKIYDLKDKDDQRGFTTICNQSDNIAIDTERKIFSNKADHPSIFNGYPACNQCSPKDRLKRYLRAIVEYGSVFLIEICVFLFALLIFLRYG